MKMEHVALNVKDPRAMAEWYRQHLDFTVAREMREAPYTHFLADSAGAVMLEIYHNPPDATPEYNAMDPLQLHLAFVSADPEADKERLVAGGAALVKEERHGDGSHLVMLRDPWGLPIQLCKRGEPMLRP